LCALYVYILFFAAKDSAGASSGGVFSSLQGVMKLVQNPRGNLWPVAHYLP
jgi:hypothetical protein